MGLATYNKKEVSVKHPSLLVAKLQVMNSYLWCKNMTHPGCIMIFDWR